MKITKELELEGFSVPNYVLAKYGRLDRPTPKFALEELEAVTLAGLCDQFRKDVFKKAKKVDCCNSNINGELL